MSDTPKEPWKMTVNEALAIVMADLPGISKERHQGGGDEGKGIQYAYRGIEQITREVQGLFAKHGVVVIPSVQSYKIVDIVVNSKPWTDTILEVEYTLVGPDGSTLTARTMGIGRDNSDKGANKAMTQAFKYLLLQVLCVSDADDDADGTTHIADSRGDGEKPATRGRSRKGRADPEPEPTPVDPVLQARAGKVFEFIRDADAAIQNDVREWRAERSLKVPDLIANPEWLGEVESYLAFTADFEPLIPPEPPHMSDEEHAHAAEIAAQKLAAAGLAPTNTEPPA